MEKSKMDRLTELVALSYEEIMLQQELFKLAQKARNMEQKLQSVTCNITTSFSEGTLSYDCQAQKLTFYFPNRAESILCNAKWLYELIRADYLVKAGYVDRYSNDLMSLEEIDVQQDARLFGLFMKFYTRVDLT